MPKQEMLRFAQHDKLGKDFRRGVLVSEGKAPGSLAVMSLWDSQDHLHGVEDGLGDFAFQSNGFVSPGIRVRGTMHGIDYPRTKRFFESFNADPAFRERYRQSPRRVLEDHALAVDPAWIEEILQVPRGKEHESAHPYLHERFAKTRRNGELTRCLHSEPMRNKRFQWWRERQLNRLRASCHLQVFDTLAHFPIAFELSEGCSGRCPFCCFSPPPLKNVLPYTNTNGALWRSVLERSADIVGPSVKYALCYYATEPLDNPDYERFVLDFREMFDWWPQLTTRKHLDNPARVRNYIGALVDEDSLESGMLRFSIISLDMLHRVHEEYSPEELEHVEVILNNPESSYRYAPAGRARELLDDWRNRGIDPGDKFYMPGLVACASGFIVNLCSRSIRLVSPCHPDDAHPQGYLLFDSRSFNDAEDYAEKLLEMIEAMPDFPAKSDVLAFGPGFDLEKWSDGIAVSTRFLRRRFQGDEHFVHLVELIQQGRYTWDDVKRRFNSPFLTEHYLRSKVRTLFDLGLMEEPARKAALGSQNGREAERAHELDTG